MYRFVILSLFCLAVADAYSQELTPRAYWPAPVGTDVLIIGYQNTGGDIVVDASLPVSGVDSDIDYFQLAYQRALDVFGRSASVHISQAYADGRTRGTLDEQFLQRITTGMTDTRFRFAVNLKGAPAMTPAEFAALRENRRMIVGASIIVQAPSGAYESNKIINLGTNRWSVKPAIGMIVPLKSWLLEAEVGAWIFGDNHDFLGANREQDEIVSAALHLVKEVRSGFWASIDANWYRGGQTRVGNSIQENLQRNSRAGFTIVVPVRGRHAFRGSYSTGVATRSGGDFEMLSLSYLFAW